MYMFFEQLRDQCVHSEKSRFEHQHLCTLVFQTPASAAVGTPKATGRNTIAADTIEADTMVADTIVADTIVVDTVAWELLAYTVASEARAVSDIVPPEAELVAWLDVLAAPAAY